VQIISPPIAIFCCMIDAGRWSAIRDLAVRQFGLSVHSRILTPVRARTGINPAAYRRSVFFTEVSPGIVRDLQSTHVLVDVEESSVRMFVRHLGLDRSPCNGSLRRSRPRQLTASRPTHNTPVPWSRQATRRGLQPLSLRQSGMSESSRELVALSLDPPICL